MNRFREIIIVNNKIAELVEKEYAVCGIFRNRKVFGDITYTYFEGTHFLISWSPKWEYIEIFGASKEEFDAFEKHYNRAVKIAMKKRWY